MKLVWKCIFSEDQCGKLPNVFNQIYRVYVYFFNTIRAILLSEIEQRGDGEGGEWIRNIMQGSIAARTLGCYKILPVWRRV